MRHTLTAFIRPSWLAIALVWNTCAIAAEPPQPTEQAIALDERIQALKQETLELNRGLQDLEDEFSYPADTALAVYVGVSSGNVFLTDVTITVDNQPPVHYSYQESEARSLLKTGLHRVMRSNVEAGPHRISAEFVAKRFDDVKAPPITTRVEGVFEKGENEAEIFANYGIKSSIAPFKRYEIGSKEDPRVRAADFLNGDSRHFSALINLLQLRREQQRRTLAADHLWRLAESYTAFGMRTQAEASLKELAPTTSNAVRLARARLKLAQFQYQRGYLQEAATTLLRMRDKLPQSVLVEWQDLLSRSLMAQGRYGDSEEVLTEMKNGDKQNPYTRFNLGVALINTGRVEEGVTILDKIGRSQVTDTEGLALKDKANLTLGYHFLRKQQGGTALPIFGRIRVEGPYSNRALLGMGWAELAPRGNKERKTKIEDEPAEQNPLQALASLGVLINPARLEQDVFKRAGINSFALKGKVKKKDEDQLKRALVPWAELINRDAMDPAVQEAMLAIPFALDRIGAHEQAKDFYERAVAFLEETRKRLDTSTQHVKESRMVETIVRRDIDAESGRNWRLRDLPDAPETFYLQTIISENRYQEALKNYRDVRFLGNNLDGVKTRLDTLDAIYARTQPKDVAPTVLIERARLGRTPEKAKIAPKLRLDVQLTTPYNPIFKPTTLPPLALRLSQVPPKFDGIRERSAQLRRAITDLRPRIASAGGEQSEVLKEIAVRELANQKKLVEKYLVEARFALARIYEGRDPEAKK